MKLKSTVNCARSLRSGLNSCKRKDVRFHPQPPGSISQAWLAENRVPSGTLRYLKTPYDSFRLLSRILFVPLGHTIIAHRFIGGIECRIERKAPQGAKDLLSRIAILQIFVVSVDNLSSLSGLNLPTGNSPTLERVGYCRASQGDEELRPNPLTMATFCLHNKCFEPLFSRRNILHGVAPRGDRDWTFMLIALIELV